MKDFTPKATCQNRLTAILNFAKRSDEETSRLSLNALAKPLANQCRKFGHKSQEYRMNTKAAFTLAEVLITLGIIGIVAAITIPSLIASYQKTVAVNRLKSVYTELIQAIKLSEADNGPIAGWDRTTGNLYLARVFFNTYLAPYLKIATVEDFDYPNKIYKRLNGELESSHILLWEGSKIYTLLDGTQLFIGPTTANSNLNIGVDINGAAKPNVIGKDYFIFSVPTLENQSFAKVVPFGAYEKGCDDPFGEYTRENVMSSKTPKGYNYKCNKGGRGFFCAALIMIDGWKISKDYPW
jgi:prepilin-type N-terminal cleavage/methylation domain-containing protein